VPGSGLPHRPREAFTRHEPLHVTLRIRDGLPTLRQKRAFVIIHAALVGGCRHGGFRVVHYSVQRNHLHLVAEAPSADALSRGVRALGIRLTRGLNPEFGERGRLFADRYHVHVLRSPLEVRNALRYVLANARRHATADRGRHLRRWIDPYSSGLWFEGWQGLRGEPPAHASRMGPLGRDDPRFLPGANAETAPAQSYLLTRGWRARGLIPTGAVPRGRA
jgi:REP element-mobilizing transposase RayT